MAGEGGSRVCFSMFVINQPSMSPPLAPTVFTNAPAPLFTQILPFHAGWASIYHRVLKCQNFPFLGSFLVLKPFSRRLVTLYTFLVRTVMDIDSSSFFFSQNASFIYAAQNASFMLLIFGFEPGYNKDYG